MTLLRVQLGGPLFIGFVPFGGLVLHAGRHLRPVCKGVIAEAAEDLMRELDVVDQLSAVAKRRPLRAIPELTLLGIRQEQIVGLHQIGDEVAGLVHHPLRQTEPLLLRENGRVSGLDVGVFLELLGVRDDLHLGQFVTAEGRAAYIGPLVWPRVSVACRSISPPRL